MNLFQTHTSLITQTATTPHILLMILIGLVYLQPEPVFAQRSGAVERKATKEQIEILNRHGMKEARVHDPSSIVRCKDRYWFFSTGRGVTSWHSKDLNHWERGPRVMPEMPTWVKEVVPDQRGHYWAPDVIFHKGRYYLYYSVSSFGKNTSAIALATNLTLDPEDPQFQWNDEGIVIRSHKTDRFNAIDPAIIKTESKGIWMSFGSFWSGLKMFQLDPVTGKRLDPEIPLQSIAHYKAIEAPHIFEHQGWFYLFVNWDVCCRGVDSTYNIRVGRSRSVTGPYLDKEGIDLMHQGGSLFLSTDGPFIGPGHANIFEEDGTFWFSCHFYDATRKGSPTLSILPLKWTEEGWPSLDVEE